MACGWVEEEDERCREEGDTLIQAMVLKGRRGLLINVVES